MRLLGLTVVWGFLYKYICAGWFNRILVEIKSSIDLRFGWKMGVDLRRTQDIQSGFFLGN